MKTSRKDKFIAKHGKIEGELKYNEYIAKISKTSSGRNKKEWYIQKYGEIEGNIKFNDFCNKSKHTKEKFIEKYGEIEGNQKWDDYVDLKKVGSKRCIEYWICKGYSLEDGYLEIMKYQNNTSLEKLISKYGYEKAKQKFEERTNKWKITYNSVDQEEYERRCSLYDSSSYKWALKKANGIEALAKVIYKDSLDRKRFRAGKSTSHESLVCLLPIYKLLRRNGIERKQVFWGIEGNKEWFIYDNEEKCIKFYDFTIPCLNIIIEYHGISWHPHKETLTEKEWKTWKMPYTNMTADEKYAEDLKKKQLAESNNFLVLEIWSDTKEKDVQTVIKIIKEKLECKKLST